ncbi:MAG: hypothetical protein R3324_00540 [Halobacteriales archaeon]|nr:hypothetical protein [Halobacteriales archaeon]
MATEAAHDAGTAPGPLPDNLYGDLPDWDFDLWPSSTSMIMAALFLALGFTVHMQITERIDTVITGGLIPLLGIFFFSMWQMPAGTFYGITGALIVANINPIVANLTATNPLAPVFFVPNTLYAVGMALWVSRRKQPGQGISFRYVAVGHFLLIPWAVLPVTLIHIFVLQLPTNVVVFWFVVGTLVGYAGLFLAYPFTKKLLEAGVVQR